MEQQLTDLEKSLQASEVHLQDELRSVRGNRLSVDTISDIPVNFYNDQMTVQQLGATAIISPSQGTITVWDKNAVGAVAKAIEDAKIGLSASADGNVIRVSLPSLSEERKNELEKTVKKTVENCRIQIRSHRDDAMKSLKEEKEEGLLGEDQFFKLKEQAQKLVDAVNGRLEKMLEEKIKELHA